MSTPPRPVGLTLAEAAAILSQLEGPPVTVALVRSVLLLDTRGRAIEPRRTGETRLYTAEDVALVRLALRLRAEGVSPTVARIVLACLRGELVAAWRGRHALVLAIVGLRGVVLPVTAERPAHAVASVALRDIWRGIEPAMRAVRKAQPQVWQWKTQPVNALVAAGSA